VQFFNSYSPWLSSNYATVWGPYNPKHLWPMGVRKLKPIEIIYRYRVFLFCVEIDSRLIVVASKWHVLKCCIYPIAVRPNDRVEITYIPAWMCRSNRQLCLPRPSGFYVQQLGGKRWISRFKPEHKIWLNIILYEVYSTHDNYWGSGAHIVT